MVPRTRDLFVLTCVGRFPFVACGLPLVTVVGDEVEGIPVLVDFVSECCLSEEAWLVVIFALHVNYGDTKDVTAS